MTRCFCGVCACRLRHIIEAYADGPGVLCELLQNADDAGATEAAFMLDETAYGTGSLLGGRMADWQGPALVAYNDAVFAPADFAAIARIGQDSKARRRTAVAAAAAAHPSAPPPWRPAQVDRPATAGRFGLGAPRPPRNPATVSPRRLRTPTTTPRRAEPPP